MLRTHSLRFPSFRVQPAFPSTNKRSRSTPPPPPLPSHLPFHLPLLPSFSFPLFLKYVHAPPVFLSLCFLSYVSRPPPPVPLDALATSSTRTCPFPNRCNRHFPPSILSPPVFVPPIGKSVGRGSSSFSLSRMGWWMGHVLFSERIDKILSADSLGNRDRMGIENSKVGPLFCRLVLG